MMKIALLAALLASAITYGQQQASSGGQNNGFKCDPNSDDTNGEVCYAVQCTDAIQDQINRELNAAFSYLYLAARFDDTLTARPGMAKFLYESASEERHHAVMMIDYLNERGIAYNKPYTFHISNDLNATAATFDAALTKAYKMEIEVTNYIYEIVEKCEADFHGADFFTEPILAEQHEGVRKLKGAIRTYNDLRGANSDSSTKALADFIFDNKLLTEGL